MAVGINGRIKAGRTGQWRNRRSCQRIDKIQGVGGSGHGRWCVWSITADAFISGLRPACLTRLRLGSPQGTVAGLALSLSCSPLGRPDLLIFLRRCFLVALRTLFVPRVFFCPCFWPLRQLRRSGFNHGLCFASAGALCCCATGRRRGRRRVFWGQKKNTECDPILISISFDRILGLSCLDQVLSSMWIGGPSHSICKCLPRWTARLAFAFLPFMQWVKYLLNFCSSPLCSKATSKSPSFVSAPGLG